MATIKISGMDALELKRNGHKILRRRCSSVREFINLFQPQFNFLKFITDYVKKNGKKVTSEDMQNIPELRKALQWHEEDNLRVTKNVDLLDGFLRKKTGCPWRIIYKNEISQREDLLKTVYEEL
jgi:hypothetical protein